MLKGLKSLSNLKMTSKKERNLLRYGKKHLKVTRKKNKSLCKNSRKEGKIKKSIHSQKSSICASVGLF